MGKAEIAAGKERDDIRFGPCRKAEHEGGAEHGGAQNLSNSQPVTIRPVINATPIRPMTPAASVVDMPCCAMILGMCTCAPP